MQICSSLCYRLCFQPPYLGPDCIIRNCYNTGNVSGTQSVDGVAGDTSYSTSTYNSYNTGNVSGTDYAGGVIGFTNQSSLASCYNTGIVSSTGRYVGGIAGLLDDSTGDAINLYNTVSGRSYTGGIIDYISTGDTLDIRYCYHLSTLGLPTYGGYTSAPVATGGGAFTNDASGLAPLLTSLNANRAGNKEWTRYTNGVINSGLPYFVQ